MTLTPQQEALCQCGRFGPFRPGRKICKKCESDAANARQKKIDPAIVRAKNAQWRANNPEKVREHERRKRSKPGAKEKQARTRRQHFLANKDRYYDQNASRRAARRFSHGDNAEYAATVAADPCSYCDGSAETVDHVDPVVDGGANTWENFTGACRSCNASKGPRRLLVWLATR